MIKNISDSGTKILKEQPEIYWATPRRPVVDVFRKNVDDFGTLTPAALERLRQSQILASDPPVKVLEEKNGWCLIQMVDLTCGWVPMKFLKKLPAKNYWAAIKRFGGSPVSVKITPEQFVETLAKWPAPKYVWGGRQSTGQDCSGMVQEIFLKTTEHWLPKHSKDQEALGQPVEGAWAVGDLVLMKNMTTGVSHVGIVSDPRAKVIFHHSRPNGAPRFEPWSDLSKRYQFLSVTRLLSFPA